MYGVLFSCLTSRAVHLEMADSLETDAFLNAMRRFISRRGNIKLIRSDNGTNFRGAERELREALQRVNQENVQKELQQKGIEWKFNPPAASWMGGAWERMIRSVRKTLAPLLQRYGTRIDKDTYHTFLCEVESIVNSRP